MATEANTFYTQKPSSQENQSEAGEAKAQKKTDSKRPKAKADSKPKETVVTVKTQEKEDKEKSKAKTEANTEANTEAKTEAKNGTARKRKRMKNDEVLAKRAAREVALYKSAKELNKSKITVTGKPGSGLNKVTKILDMHGAHLERRRAARDASRDGSEDFPKDVSSLVHLQSFVEARKTGEIDLVNDKIQGKPQPAGVSTRKDADIFDIALDIPQPPVPNLSFGLDRVLFK